MLCFYLNYPMARTKSELTTKVTTNTCFSYMVIGSSLLSKFLEDKHMKKMSVSLLMEIAKYDQKSLIS